MKAQVRRDEPGAERTVRLADVLRDFSKVGDDGPGVGEQFVGVRRGGYGVVEHELNPVRQGEDVGQGGFDEVDSLLQPFGEGG